MKALVSSLSALMLALFVVGCAPSEEPAPAPEGGSSTEVDTIPGEDTGEEAAAEGEGEAAAESEGEAAAEGEGEAAAEGEGEAAAEGEGEAAAEEKPAE